MAVQSSHLKWLTALTITFICFVTSAKAQETIAPVCSTGYFEVYAKPETTITSFPTRTPNTCALIINGVPVELWAFEVTESGKSIDYAKMEEKFSNTTGASTRPDRDISLANAASLFRFVFGDEVIYKTHSGKEFTRGYATGFLSINLGVFGIWQSPRPLTDNPLAHAISIKLHRDGVLSSGRILGLKALALAKILLLIFPLIVLFALSETPKWIDRYIPYTTALSKIVIFLLIPGLLILLVFAIVDFIGYTTLPIMADAIAITGVILLYVNFIKLSAETKVQFTPFYTSTKAKYFVQMKVNATKIETEGGSYEVAQYCRLILWFPYWQTCPSCGKRYIIHTASSSEIPITLKEYEDRKITDEQYKTLYFEAHQKSRPPYNGCPYCGCVPPLEQRRAAKSRSNWKLSPSLKTIAILTLIGIAALGGMALCNQFKDSPIAEFFGAMCGEAGLGLSASGAVILITAGLYSIVKYLTTRYATHASVFLRIWVCPREGYLFEDISLVAETEKCPSCQEPILAFRRPLCRRDQ